VEWMDSLLPNFSLSCHYLPHPPLFHPALFRHPFQYPSNLEVSPVGSGGARPLSSTARKWQSQKLKGPNTLGLSFSKIAGDASHWRVCIEATKNIELDKNSELKSTTEGDKSNLRFHMKCAPLKKLRWPPNLKLFPQHKYG